MKDFVRDTIAAGNVQDASWEVELEVDQGNWHDLYAPQPRTESLP